MAHEPLVFEPGLTGVAQVVVTPANCASSVSSGALNVYSTPNMIGLMEDAAFHAVDKLLPEGYSTVGTEVKIVHLSACPLGRTVVATAVLERQENRRLLFRVEARSGEVLLGEGYHERAIINVERFVGRIAETWRLSPDEARRVEEGVPRER